jgi:hypothetical protein
LVHGTLCGFCRLARCQARLPGEVALYLTQARAGKSFVKTGLANRTSPERDWSCCCNHVEPSIYPVTTRADRVQSMAWAFDRGPHAASEFLPASRGNLQLLAATASEPQHSPGRAASGGTQRNPSRHCAGAAGAGAGVGVGGAGVAGAMAGGFAVVDDVVVWSVPG